MPTPPKVIDEKDDVIIVSIRLASGKFESSIQMPLHSDEDARKRFVESWFVMLQAGLQLGKGT